MQAVDCFQDLYRQDFIDNGDNNHLIVCKSNSTGLFLQKKDHVTEDFSVFLLMCLHIDTEVR